MARLESHSRFTISKIYQGKIARRSGAIARAQSGQSLVEMALVLPLLLLLLLGIIEMGRYAAMSLMVTNAARAGVQYGAQNLATAGDNTGIENAAHNESPIVPASATNVTTSVVCSCSGVARSCTIPCTGGDPIVSLKVSTNATYTPLFTYPGIPINTTLNGSAEMQVAQ